MYTLCFAIIVLIILLLFLKPAAHVRGGGGGILLVGEPESCAKLRGYATVAGYDACREEAYAFTAVRDLILREKPRLILSDIFLLNPIFGLELTRLCEFLGVQLIVVLTEARNVRPEIEQIRDDRFQNVQLFHGRQIRDIVEAIKDSMDPHWKRGEDRS